MTWSSFASRSTQNVIPNDEGNIVLVVGAVLSGVPSSTGAAAPLGQFVEFLGRQFLPLRGEHPDQVAVPHALLVDLLLGPTRRPQQVLQDHLLKFLPDLRRGGDGLQDRSHDKISTVI